MLAGVHPGTGHWAASHALVSDLPRPADRPEGTRPLSRGTKPKSAPDLGPPIQSLVWATFPHTFVGRVRGPALPDALRIEEVQSRFPNLGLSCLFERVCRQSSGALVSPTPSKTHIRVFANPGLCCLFAHVCGQSLGPLAFPDSPRPDAP